MKQPISFNRNVSRDLKDILSFYEEEGGAALADKFFELLMARIEQIRENPEQFPFSDLGIRRANLEQFPYHLLYRVNPERVRIFVLRHDSRKPSYGMRRR
ncbi:MAG: type II toxin-antitoxin system RelE/ParE family toxin [Verrucomicrobiota bacterium]